MKNWIKKGRSLYQGNFNSEENWKSSRNF
jgi:hypothetical protein